MKKEPEPLAELLYQEFPRTDPVELERITKTVIKWLEQKHKYFKKMSRQIARKLGEEDTGTLVSNAYPRCIEELLRELNPQDYPLST
jgi:DNA primase large subunit